MYICHERNRHLQHVGSSISALTCINAVYNDIYPYVCVYILLFDRPVVGFIAWLYYNYKTDEYIILN